MRKTAPMPTSARKAKPPIEPPIMAPRGGDVDASEVVDACIGI
jgi:hypothetical protein